MKDQDAFKRENPRFAELFLRKYGHLNPSVRLLDREFVRFKVNYFDRPYTDEMVLGEIDASFAVLYGALQALQEEEDARRENEPNELEWRTDLEQRRLLELAKWHKTIEYLRPYDEGNTRISVLVLNKLLVELGFVPTILAQQNDAPFRSNRGWRRNIIAGMQRWQAIRLFRDMGLLSHLLSFRFQAEPPTTSLRASAVCARAS